jgi:methylenetetrahydrofolate dehydrogenase (NADP+)/methenyltetrahydrofolate cyclohydrolase
MAVILDGKSTSKKIRDEIRIKVEELKKNDIGICLAVVLVGDDPASHTYVNNKKKACEYTGIESRLYELPEDTSQAALLSIIGELNGDDRVNGILVQLPLPPHIDEQAVIGAIAPAKDVDGFHPASVGALSIGMPGLVSCTPAGIIQLLKRYDIKTDGAECVIVSRSNIVGKPMGMLMLRENATVTIAHSHTRDLKTVTGRADILITATGKPKMFDRSFVKPGATVIDCGMDRDAEGHLCGDVDFEDVEPVCSAITPVPGGVGPMTIAMLMSNCLDAAVLQGTVQ